MARRRLPPAADLDNKTAVFAQGRGGALSQEVASIRGGKDITRPYLDTLGNLLLPEDEILLLKGGLGWRRLEVYEQVRQNAQVFSCLQQRFTAVTQAEWDVFPGARKGRSNTKADERAAGFIKDQLSNGFGRWSWDAVNYQMLWGVFYGYSVGELVYARDGNYIGLNADRGGIRVRNRKRFGFDWDGDARLITPTKALGEKLPANKFWVFNVGADHSDDPYGLGLGHWLYWLDWFQRNDLKFWLFFLEKWAQPTPIGTYPAGTPEDKQLELLETLAAIMTDAGVIVPEGTAIDLLEAARSGSADYSEIYDRMDAGISKVCLSQTMTTDDGSSLSQAQVHAGVAQHVIKHDADLINGSFNSGPVRWLCDFNREALGECTYPQVWRKVEPDEDTNARADRETKIFALGYRLTEEKFEEVFGEGYELLPPPPAPVLVPKPGDQPGGENGHQTTEGPPDTEATIAAEEAAAAFSQPEPAVIEAYTDRLRSQARPIFGGMMERLSELLESSEDLAEFRDKLDRTYPDLDDGALVALFQQALTAGRVAGIYEAQEGQ